MYGLPNYWMSYMVNNQVNYLLSLIISTSVVEEKYKSRDTVESQLEDVVKICDGTPE